MPQPLSGREYVEWGLYQQLHGPVGPERDDYGYALVAKTLADVNRRKGRKPAKLERFLLWRNRRDAREPWQAVRARVMRAYGQAPPAETDS